MKVVVLYRPQSEHGTMVEQYARDFLHRTSRALELLDVDSKEGVRLAELYDIVSYPTVVALDNGGQLVSSWRATETMPLIDEVSAYLVER